MEKFGSKEIEKEISIGQAESDDALAIRKIEHETWMATYPSEESGITQEDIDWYFNDFKKTFSENSIEKTENELRELPDNQEVIIAKSGDKAVGFAWLTKNNELNELGSIYILPEFQGSGIGSDLWKSAQVFFDENKSVRVTVAEHNKKAVDFYKKLGFVETGSKLSKLIFPSGAKFDEIEMVREPTNSK